MNQRRIHHHEAALTARCSGPNGCEVHIHVACSSHSVQLSLRLLQVDLPVEDGVVLLDIAFTGDDPKHGFLSGTRQTLLETFNGGKTWEPRYIESVDEEGINYRYNSISFNGSEGWIVGKPGMQLVSRRHISAHLSQSRLNITS
jgi:photosystem II stability/assembly factor-like uncharacterized protein